MIYTENTMKAMSLAERLHRGQTDKCGAPYIFHVLHVAEQMTDEISTIAALLHDTLEDTALTPEQLDAMDFPPQAGQAVKLLTHDPSVPYLDYVRALRVNPVAVQVKLADLAHNSDAERNKLLPQTEKHCERFARYIQAQAILRVTPVVAALIWDGERFLICQRPADKKRGLLWEFVGGKVEAGETKAQALIRECREELGITVSVGEVFREVTHCYPDLTVQLTLFHATIAQGTPQLLEHNDMQWITPQEIDNYEFCPADVEILEQIKKYDKKT